MKHQHTQFEYEQLPVSSERILPAAPYPRQHIHGVFSNLEHVVRAVHGLRAAGYVARDIHTLASWDFVEAVAREQQKHNSLFQACKRLFSSLDDGFGDTYLRAAREGQHILAVRVCGCEQIPEARDLLTFHGGRLLKYVDAWTVTNLAPPLALQWAMSVLSSSVPVSRR